MDLVIPYCILYAYTALLNLQTRQPLHPALACSPLLLGLTPFLMDDVPRHLTILVTLPGAYSTITCKSLAK
jgi:hypothetical protein